MQFGGGGAYGFISSDGCGPVGRAWAMRRWAVAVSVWVGVGSHMPSTATVWAWGRCGGHSEGHWQDDNMVSAWCRPRSPFLCLFPTAHAVCWPHWSAASAVLCSVRGGVVVWQSLYGRYFPSIAHFICVIDHTRTERHKFTVPFDNFSVTSTAGFIATGRPRHDPFARMRWMNEEPAVKQLVKPWLEAETA